MPIRYATALYKFVALPDVQLKLYNEINSTLKNLNTFPAFRNTMLNPIYKLEQKKGLILQALGAKISDELNRFIDIILENNREYILPEILNRYLSYYREKNNILSAKMTSSTKINNETSERLFSMIEKITNSKIEMETEIDPTIIGGFILEVDNMRWEASIANELERIRKDFQIKNKKIS
jgi:F-type H+-transporting ATPase subunit delta